MPLPFSLVCDLLDASYARAIDRKPTAKTVAVWCSRHCSRINASDTNLAALLSTLLPEKRTDRVYCIRANGLEKLIGRSLMLGASRLKELALYKQPGLDLDLADCVERILTVTPNPTLAEGLQVTVEEIDETLHSVAAKVKWSSPSIRSSEASLVETPGREGLEALYRRLSAKEAKWLTRLILKDFQPLVFDEYALYRSFDPLLPLILKVREDFTTAINTLQRLKEEMPSPRPGTSYADRKSLSSVKPQLSVKVGRQQWHKARSMKHCLQMCKGLMSVEAKVDGEYCQIHVDVSKGRRGIQIFSKSGKDSTEDRAGLIGAIMKSLAIGNARCHVKTECILEGELVVYSELIVHCDRGQAELVQRQLINTNHPMAASDLRNAFAKVIRERGEGLVLKADQPYFNFENDAQPFTNRCIKLKKDYIGRFGEVGDFAVVGAGFDAAKARSYSIDNLKWTHFYVGCLDNREEVKRWNAIPEFTAVNVVELNETMLKSFLLYANPNSVPVEENVDTKVKHAAGAQPVAMAMAFTNPPVFDMRCFSFERASSTNWWSLRFPSVAKIHFDRDFSDVLSFDELQKIAEGATSARDVEDSQENLAWIARLEQADPRGLAVDAATQLTATTMPTPSPRRASHNSSGSQPLIRHLTDGFLERSVGSVDAMPPPPHKLAASQPSPVTDLSKAGLSDTHKPKRPAFSAALFPPAKKSRMDYGHNESKPFLLGPELESESPKRRPLGEIDGNSTCTQQLRTLAPAPAVRLPDDENPTVDSGSAHDAEDKHLDQTSQQPKDQCKYAGLECQLTDRLILLPNYFSDLKDVEPLFRAHGLANIIRDAEAWIQNDAVDTCPLANSQTGRNKILFVDTVNKEAETKALLSKLEDVRESISEERREWISVFDWRVLHHLAIFEDAETTKKYYDGFHDPWRRWYSGLV
ncbi:hypothetical protein M419DRAFT_97984 [Trichoderma reesei RUT C-30]|uniref:ATP-dependent DNA ligase family profile domain-containing protein n=1 Tax=Hypocrea jecorina (strain ATCC 56765 / BCRC 32924 / NRRL 11460 / Rut C-30) TaxID=1344414 RepID=A0A024SFP3_HYPJR|nr:hypothetical protein M419DRAFT_97984 [Trichoderma reesei RUT C-30]